jgi:hypothetical protein
VPVPGPRPSALRFEPGFCRTSLALARAAMSWSHGSCACRVRPCARGKHNKEPLAWHSQTKVSAIGLGCMGTNHPYADRADREYIAIIHRAP